MEILNHSDRRGFFVVSKLYVFFFILLNYLVYSVAMKHNSEVCCSLQVGEIVRALTKQALLMVLGKPHK